ncbi:hypothetical protein DMH25_45475 [Streptomyces sp. WAC 01325]|uniref:hypothetical protein n=1 Tax=Streptomyces sp. WAC 01325 TaxID=2203202 RepID=UPI000F887796|nr:hypothetical protein [Streptomyces sp. WAC 01325]RSM84672.1 hypothetical protein DMH25_45475 [Streptomyces sp. WAC 01325]
MLGHGGGLLQLRPEHDLLRAIGRFAAFLVGGRVLGKIQDRSITTPHPIGTAARYTVTRHSPTSLTAPEHWRLAPRRSVEDFASLGLVRDQHYVLACETTDEQMGDLLSAPGQGYCDLHGHLVERSSLRS